MKRPTILFVAALAIATETDALVGGWDTPAKYLAAVSFARNGTIEFVLFNEGTAGADFLCGPTGTPDRQWLVIGACSGAGEATCLASVNRMASVLLAAKLAGKPVHVKRGGGCTVTAVSLKP